MRDEDIEIESLNDENIFKLSPNPTKDILEMSSTKLISHSTIYTLTGQPVLQTADTEINVSALPAGMYIVRAVTTTGEQLQSKFIKQ